MGQKFGSPKTKMLRMLLLLWLPISSICCQIQPLLLAERMNQTATTQLWKPAGPSNATFSYELGTFLKGVELLGDAKNDSGSFNYIKLMLDRFIAENGSISTYNRSKFALDDILTGRLLLTVLDKTGEPKYKKAADLLYSQIRQQPRTHEGGFWHKLIYPYQMWLDGLYMAEPFYAQYALGLDPSDRLGNFSDIANQFIIMENRSRDSETGLLYHGYDESRAQNWSDPRTGHSPAFWARGMGWFAMAVIDALDYFPKDHPKRGELLGIVNRTAIAVKNVQDPATGLWWEVLDKGGEAENFLESSASAMFVYFFAKGVRMGLLPESYGDLGLKGYSGMVDHFVEELPGNGLNFTGTVSGAGLGGNPYRNGTYAYYVSVPVVSQDQKGVGAFLMASVEVSMLPNSSCAPENGPSSSSLAFTLEPMFVMFALNVLSSFLLS